MFLLGSSDLYLHCDCVKEIFDLSSSVIIVNMVNGVKYCILCATNLKACYLISSWATSN